MNKTGTKQVNSRLIATPESILKVPKKAPGEETTFFDYDPLEIARQICLLDFEVWSKIMVGYYGLWHVWHGWQPSELMEQRWNKEKTQAMSPNVLKMSQRSTDLSLWAAGLILESPRVNIRAKRFQKFVAIAEVPPPLESLFDISSSSEMPWIEQL